MNRNVPLMAKTGLRRSPFPVPLAEDGTPRWSSLNRYTGLSASAGVRSGKLAVVRGDGPLVVALRQKRQRREDTIPRKVRAMVLERDGCRCVCCGRPVVGQRYSLGHRLRASQGGKAVPSNLLVFLGWGGEACHGRIDSRRDPHDEAKGYTCRSWQDPAQIPVMVFSEGGSGVMAWLWDDGQYHYDGPQAGAA